ncbi:MAG: flagellar biosynthesis protein FlhF [Phycisphaerae bacterium]|nr:flagellar biosynthesis protein FlhF [Phycisphaerae bacterium]MDW8263503.1 flagellar biosynthesis protein FlhF [Phycisphaerales bacterium]
MQLKTFQARTMADCLSLVKSEMGAGAVILHTRKIERRRWLGLRRFEIVEITAGKGVNIPVRRPGSPQPGPVSALAPRPTAPGRELLGTPAVASITTLALKNEIETVKSMLKQLSQDVRNKVAGAAEFPEELFEHYRSLIEHAVAEELARDIIRKIRDSIRPEHLSQADFVRERIADQLEKLIPVAGPLHRKRTSGPHVVALIGPTGVGKTTTIAKLAANLKLRERQRVGLITLDTYRIAAIDQLRKYAEILGSALRVVATPEDMRGALAAMQDCDFVLIDTAGRSPNDALKLSELKALLSAAAVDETHLVLSSTASQSCVELAMEKFGEVHFDRVIFTKLDEATQMGVILNVVRSLNTSISYITTGQDVPDDIEVGRGRRLAQLILGMGL